MLLSISNLISSKLEAGAPFSKLFSSKLMSHKNPYSSWSVPLEEVIWSLVLVISWENWRWFSRELLWFWLWFWWDGVEAKEVIIIWLYPQGMVWLVGGDESQALVLSNVLFSEFGIIIPLLLWNTLHKTQSSCHQNHIINFIIHVKPKTHTCIKYYSVVSWHDLCCLLFVPTLFLDQWLTAYVTSEMDKFYAP